MDNKVSWAKVEDSIWDLESEFKSGKLWAGDPYGDFVLIETEGDFSLAHSQDNIFRKLWNGKG